MADNIQSQIDAARKAGYTDDQILTHLSTKGGLGDKIKTAKGAGYGSSDILKHLETNPTIATTSPGDKRGAKSSPTLTDQALGLGSDILEGVGSGVLSTAQGAYNLGRKGVSAVGLGELPAPPEWLQKAAAPVQYTKDEAGNEIPTDKPSLAFRGGRTAEQIGEFFIPGGATAKLGKAAETAVGVGKLGTLARIGATAAGEAAMAGGITSIQTGGDWEAAENAALTAGIASGAFNTVGTMLQSLPLDKLYLSKLKFPERFRGQRVDDIMDKAIGEGILISKGGAEKIGQIEKLEKVQRDALISQHLDDMVNIDIIQAPVLKMRQMAADLGETGIVQQIDSRLSNFFKAKGMKPPIPGTPAQTNPVYLALGTGPKTIPGTPGSPGQGAQITVRDAIKAKDDFQMLAQNFFGKFSEGKGQIRKLISGGLNDALEDISPAYKEMNKDIQNSKLLKQAINKYIDSNPGTFADPRTAILAWWSVPAAVIRGVLASPYMRSALAIGTSRVGQAAPTIGSTVGRVAASQVPNFMPPVPERPKNYVEK